MASKRWSEEQKVIEKIVWRLRTRVKEQMKKIPSNELYGWKEGPEE